MPDTTNTAGSVEGYIKVQLDYAPKTNGKKFTEWCAAHNFDYLGSDRRAWCSSLGTYFRGAAGVAYNDGEPFLFYEDDLVDMEALIATHTDSRAAETLERIKSKGHGGGNWRRLIESELAALHKEESV